MGILNMSKFAGFFLAFLFSGFSFSIDFTSLEKNLSASSSLKTDKAVKSRAQELDSIVKEIDEELEKNPESAKLAFLKGRAIYSYVYTIKPPFSKDDLENIREIKADAHTWLSKSAQYNNDELTIGQLYILRGFSSDLAVYAVEQILASDRYFDDKERVELKRNKIDHLIRLNRYGDAVAEMEQFNQDYPAFASAEWDDAFMAQIEEAKVKSNKDRAFKLEENTPAPQTAAAPVKPAPQLPTPVVEQPASGSTKNLWWLLLVGLVVAVLISVMIKRR